MSSAVANAPSGPAEVTVTSSCVQCRRNGCRHESVAGCSGEPWVALQPVTQTTADRFGRIAAALRKAGTPIPSNDIWIAAHAFETGAELVTYDKHFESIRGLPTQIL